MSRVNMVDPENADDRVRALFADQVRTSGVVSHFSRVLANTPGALEGWRSANKEVRIRHLGDDDWMQIVELVIIKTSMLNDGRYCWAHNTQLGREVGLSEEQIRAVAEDYALSTALSAMQQYFSDHEIVELTVVSCMWNFSNRFCEALD